MKKPSKIPSVTIQCLALLSLLCFIPGAYLKANDETSKSKTVDAKQQRLISLVLLLSEPRTIDAAAIAHAVSHALGVEVSDDAVTAKPPSFVVKAGTRRFAINSVDEPYFAEGEKLATELNNASLSNAIRKNRAWISVDWMENDDKADLRKVYLQISLIIAQFVRKDTLAIYSPDTDQFHLNDATLLGHLKSADPLHDLVPAGLAAAEGATKDSTITISSDDPQLVAAQEQAEEHWPEFLKAFKERTKDQYFAVKGRILEGDKGEYLWLQVSDIDDKLIHGKLDNDPTDLKKVARGADLHIPIADVDDWLYSTISDKGQEEIIGGYTLKVFDQLAAAKHKN